MVRSFDKLTSELSHSALWAWILQSLDSDDPPLEGPNCLANGLIKFLAIRQIKPPVTVNTEVKLPGGGRLDIELRDGSGTVLAIENKVKANPTKAQLDKYRESIPDSSNLHLALISTAFDEHFRVESPWRHVGMRDLLRLVNTAFTSSKHSSNSLSRLNSTYLSEPHEVF